MIDSSIYCNGFILMTIITNAKIVLDGEMQARIDAEDSLEVW